MSSHIKNTASSCSTISDAAISYARQNTHFNIYLIRVLENIQPHISPGLQGDISSTENELIRD